MADELDEIFVDKNEPVDKSLLVSLIKPFATIDLECTVSYTENFDKLEEMKKVIVYLLCKKAICLKNIKAQTESATLSEISKKAFVSESNVKNAVYTHYSNIIKKEGKGFIVPSYNLRKIKTLLLGDENE